MTYSCPVGTRQGLTGWCAALVSIQTAAILAFCVVTPVASAANEPASPAPAAPTSAKAALTVAATTLHEVTWPDKLTASGTVAAWQEAIIGAEIGNLRITEVSANVGDKVTKGQVLARIDSAAGAVELAEAKAAVAELEAANAEARANAERGRQLQAQGFFSSQMGSQYITAAQTAQARLEAARARKQAVELRLSKTRVLSPDDGVISARTATVGSLTQPGQELFRLIRGNRLEWRAEVTAGELGKFKAGQSATISGPDGQQVPGKVRTVAPTVDAQTRNALVYVDLPESTGAALRAGMFARGEFEFAQTRALTLPQSAVLLREGFAYVFGIESEAAAYSKLKQTKVATGRRQGDRIEIVSGLKMGQRVVASGSAFLTDGDTVRIVTEAGVAATVRP